jgi:hypothetical protein
MFSIPAKVETLGSFSLVQGERIPETPDTPGRLFQSSAPDINLIPPQNRERRRSAPTGCCRYDTD